MIDDSKIKDWTSMFLEHIEEVSPEYHIQEEEGYKFKSVDNFQEKFNIEAPNLSKMLDEAIENNNLVAGSFYFPKEMLTIFAGEYETETREILKDLFNEEKGIKERLNKAGKEFDKLMDKRNQRLNEDSNHFMGLRFLSILLSYRFPNKYNPIKPREWRVFCKFIDEDFKMPSNTSVGDQYKIYEDYIEKLRSYIKNQKQIKELRNKLTRGLSFEDKEFRWMTQNVIYVTSRVLAGRRGDEEPQQERTLLTDDEAAGSGNMEFPLEEYLENFIIKNWNSIDFGEEMELYIDDEGSPAQQYPTSEGYIDLLAQDKDENFVVIELKKGRSNQKVVGQILSYVGWVKNNLAEDNQKVKGIIIAADGNQALIDAVSTVRDFISIKYYRVNFNFDDPE